MIKIADDQTVVHVSENNLAYGLMVLCSCYYVYDLAFSRRYCQTLGFLQHLILKDPYLDKISAGFLTLLDWMGK